MISLKFDFTSLCIIYGTYTETEMSLYKLQSSDGKIFHVDGATVRQMVTMHGMRIGHEDENQVTPVPTVKAEVLEKIIQWTDYHKIEHEKSEKIHWYIQYFNVELKKNFEIIAAADYLQIKSLLIESCHNVLINYNLEVIENAARKFHDPKLVTLLEKYEREHGYEVVVTLVENKHLKYFDIMVTNIHIINKQDIPILDRNLDLSDRYS